MMAARKRWSRPKVKLTRHAHAADRILRRVNDADDVAVLPELEKLIEDGAFQYLRRQTRTRTLCVAVVGPADVYFIIERGTNRIVTVLTEEMAKSLL